MFHTNLFPCLYPLNITLCLSLSKNKLTPKPDISLLYESPSSPHQQLIMGTPHHLLLLPLMLAQRLSCQSPIGCIRALAGAWLAGRACPSVVCRKDPDTPQAMENYCSGSTRKDKPSTDRHLPTHKLSPSRQRGSILYVRVIVKQRLMGASGWQRLCNIRLN